MPVTVKFDPTSVSKQSQIIPDATPFNAGVMTPAQVSLLTSLVGGGGGALIVWTLAKTWAEVQAEMLAAPAGAGIVLVETDDLGTSRKVSGTNIDLDHFIFMGLVAEQGLYPSIEFEAGATLKP